MKYETPVNGSASSVVVRNTETHSVKHWDATINSWRPGYGVFAQTSNIEGWTPCDSQGNKE